MRLVGLELQQVITAKTLYLNKIIVSRVLLSNY